MRGRGISAFTVVCGMVSDVSLTGVVTMRRRIDLEEGAVAGTSKDTGVVVAV